MDKNNSSGQDELMYIPTGHTEREMRRKKLKDVGFSTRAAGVFWPAFKENPLPFIGVPLMVAAFATGLFHEWRGNKIKAARMWEIKAYVGIFTVMGFTWGIYLRNKKAKNRKEQDEEEFHRERYRQMFEGMQPPEED